MIFMANLFITDVVQSLSLVWCYATPWAAACQASLSFTISWSLLRLMSTESVIQPSHSLLPHPSALNLSQHQDRFQWNLPLCIKWPKYWSFNFSISPSSEYSGVISFRIDWFDLLAVQGTLAVQGAVQSTTIWKYQFFSARASLWSSSHIHTWLQEKP